MAPRLNLLGVEVTAFDLSTAVAEMTDAVTTGSPSYACTCPVYTLMQGHERPEVRAALNGARWVTADGVPVVWALRRMGARGAWPGSGRHPAGLRGPRRPHRGAHHRRARDHLQLPLPGARSPAPDAHAGGWPPLARMGA